MKTYCLIFLALLLPPQRWAASVTGQILDRESKPLAGAEIIYTNVGTVDRTRAQVIEGDRLVYKVKTDKSGNFTMIGVHYGVYQVEINAADGSHVYSGRRHVGNPNDKEVEAQNTLNVDLSTTESALVAPGAETNRPSKKKTKEQLSFIRQENSNAAKINRLIVQLHGALDVKDWPAATDLLRQLISLDENRWEFYQNLGTIQANLTHYEDAVKSFAKGVDVAEKTLKNAADPVQAKTSIGDLLLAEGDAYNRLGKLDEAIATYTKAAGISPHPATARYHACNMLSNNGKIDAAIESCNQAITEDPTQWEPYQILGGVLITAGKTNDAVQTYDKGVSAARKILEQKPDSGQARTGLGQMLNSEGNLLVQAKRYEEAANIFSRAAEVAAYPAMPYFNLCATLYNLKRESEAVQACGKAITADPTLADAYYIKASILFGQGKQEHGKYVTPPGTRDALNTYLQYAPSGEHSTAVRSMLDRLDEPVETTLKPSKK